MKQQADEIDSIIERGAKVLGTRWMSGEHNAIRRAIQSGQLPADTYLRNCTEGMLLRTRSWPPTLREVL